jgi:ribosomal protein S18 acetylase RimI-like enzyme
VSVEKIVMNKGYSIRPATVEDAREIARLIEISSDGVAVIEWAEAAAEEDVEPLDIGERTYRNPEGDYSWRNCTIVEKDDKVAGMLLAFAMPKAAPRDPAYRPTTDDANVFAPYMYLEEPDSWYICGVALYPEHRGQGLGTTLMNVANEQARQNGFKTLSLVAFAQNEGSVRLYKRLGYLVVDQAPVIPHPSIRYTGEAVLMVSPVKL